MNTFTVNSFRNALNYNILTLVAIRGSQFYLIQIGYFKIELNVMLWKQFNPTVLVRREKGISFEIETG